MSQPINSYNVLIDRFAAFAAGHYMISEFSHGQLDVIDIPADKQYPWMHVFPAQIVMGDGTAEYQWQVWFMDLPRDKEYAPEYIRENLSDCIRLAQDLIYEIDNGNTLFGVEVDLAPGATIIPEIREFTHTLTGVQLSFSMIVPDDYDACAIPADYAVGSGTAGGAGTGGLVFAESIVNTGGIVTLVNDEQSPGASYYYGTDENGVKGWHFLAAAATGCVTKTYAQWDDERTAGTLPGCTWIRVTDIPSQPDAVFHLFCPSSTEISLAGHGVFLNADYQNVGDYSGVAALTGIAATSNLGPWYADIELTAADGDVVIFRNLHYQVTDSAAFDGSSPEANALAYTLLPRSSADMGYIEETDAIEFDWQNDWLQYRGDKRGNALRQSKEAADLMGDPNVTLQFQWGRDSWHSNTCDDGYINQLDFPGDFYGNNVGQFCSIGSNTGNSPSQFISENTLHGGSFIRNNALTGSAAITKNALSTSSTIETNTVSSVQVRGNTLSNTAIIQNKTFSGGNFSENTIGAVQFLFSETCNDVGKRHEPGESTMERNLPIDGGGVIDISGQVEKVGVYIMTSPNPTETISGFTNFPDQFPVKFMPEQGLTVTFTFTPVGSAGASDLVGPTASITLDGDKGESITLVRGTTAAGIFQIDANTYA